MVVVVVAMELLLLVLVLDIGRLSRIVSGAIGLPLASRICTTSGSQDTCDTPETKTEIKARVHCYTSIMLKISLVGYIQP